jgi:hypothetical protein
MTATSPQHIPVIAFTGHLLPGQIYRCDMPTLHFETVQAFPESRTRPDLFGGFERLRENIAIVPLEQWIAGPFTTWQPDPDTLHCINLCDITAYLKLDQDQQEAFNKAMEAWCARAYTREHCGCHSTFVITVPEDHHHRQATDAIQRAWNNRYTDNGSRGYFVVQLIPEELSDDPDAE